MNFTARFYFKSICFISFLLAFPVFSQQAEEVPPSSIINDAKQVKESVSLIGLTKEIIVTGDMLYDSYFIGAETIQFKSGARLIFSDKALATRNNLIIAAKNIVNEDQQKPGVITWARGDGPVSAPPQSGQAPGGADGNNSGVSGSAGANGAQGNSGIAGKDAPNLTLFFISATGAPPVIDLRGQPGGQGGQGQQGGDGGNGHEGSPASSSLYECTSGAGHGGNGGSGGSGGLGGRGGDGGRGGTTTIVTLPEAFPAVLQFIRADVSGGDGGDGGDGGNGGNGGDGGAQGAKSLPWCKDEPGRRGAAGLKGQQGGKGIKGAVGIQGDVFYTALNNDAFSTILGIQK